MSGGMRRSQSAGNGCTFSPTSLGEGGEYLLEFPVSSRCVHRNVLVRFQKGKRLLFRIKEAFFFIVAAGFIVGQWATPMKYSFIKRAEED